jgi:general secretion pathway protein A
MTKAPALDLGNLSTQLGRESMDAKQPLPLAHWGLERWPFRGLRRIQPSRDPSSDGFYPTACGNEALARIAFLVESRRRLGALAGSTGVGKSLLLQVAAQQLARKSAAIACVDAAGTTTREFLWQIAVGLAAAPRDDADVAYLWRQIADRITENRVQQLDTVLFVDNAGQAGPDLVTQLARLCRIDTSPAARFTIILAAEPGQAAGWGETLRGLVDLRIDLHPWEQEDSVGYVQTALVEAGRMEPLFDDDALFALHQAARGIARDVVRLADYALIAGAAAGRNSVDRSVIEAAQEELAWPAIAAAY